MKAYGRKLKLLYLKEFFERKTDENHGATVADMAKYLKECDIEAERKALYEDVDLDGFCLDIGGIEFSLSYPDKTRLKKHYWLPADDFDNIFCIIKELVPQAENIPAVLST